MRTKNPLQVARLREITAGKKFWGYLDTEALKTRYILAAYFLRGCRNIVEIGGYRGNVITNFLTGHHDAVRVYSLDAEFDVLERHELNGAPCQVSHVQDYFQHYMHPMESLGVVALGLEIHGDFEPLCSLVGQSDIAVVEVPSMYQPSVDCLNRLLQGVPRRLRCQINLDLSPNEPLLHDELTRLNMNTPFWLRNVYVLEPPR